jgi:hypothetical protein
VAQTEVAFLAEAFMVVVAIASFFVGFPHLWNERLRRRGVKSRGVCVSPGWPWDETEGRQHRRLHLGRHLPRVRPRPMRPVRQSRRAALLIAAHPGVHRLPRDFIPGRDLRLGRAGGVIAK